MTRLEEEIKASLPAVVGIESDLESIISFCDISARCAAEVAKKHIEKAFNESRFNRILRGKPHRLKIFSHA